MQQVTFLGNGPLKYILSYFFFKNISIPGSFLYYQATKISKISTLMTVISTLPIQSTNFWTSATIILCKMLQKSQIIVNRPLYCHLAGIQFGLWVKALDQKQGKLSSIPALDREANCVILGQSVSQPSKKAMANHLKSLWTCHIVTRNQQTAKIQIFLQIVEQESPFTIMCYNFTADLIICRSNNNPKYSHIYF